MRLLVAVGCAACTACAAVQTQTPEQKFIITGHLFSVFAMPVFHMEDMDPENFEKVEWLSRKNNKHYYDPDFRRDVLALPEQRFETLVESFNQIDADAVFFLGDVALNHNEAEWNRIQKFRKKSKAPWYFVPGNHDMIKDQGQKLYMEHVGYMNKNIKIGDVLFILLRPATWDRTYTNLSKEGIAQIKEGLEIPAKHHIIMMHHRLFEKRKSNWYTEVIPLIRGKVHHVFYGDHTKEILRVWHDLDNQIQNRRFRLSCG